MRLAKGICFSFLFSGLILIWATACGPTGGDDNDNQGNQNQNNSNFNPELCGNGQIDPGEQCDDGNTEDCDGCSSTCQLQSGACCGNGIIEMGEECDDSNTTGGDGCDSLCRLELCGNNRKDEGEDCDDGNTTPGDGCNQYCLFEVCGNGVMDVNEQCDGTDFKGATCENLGYYGGTLTCDASCMYDVSTCTGICGDGVIDVPQEECDDGNTDTGDGCDDQCVGEAGTCLVDQDLGTLTQGGTLSGTVTTTGSHNLYEASCGGGTGRETVVSFTLTEYLDVTVDWASQTGSHVISVFRDDGGDCDAVERSCVDTAGAASGTAGTLTLGAGTYYVIVDAQDANSDGSVSLTLTGGTSSLPCDTQFGDNGSFIGCEITQSFEDISSSASVSVCGDDTSTSASLGFDFDFMGSTYTSVTLSTNGNLSLSGGYVSYSYASSCLPAGPSGVTGILGAFWDDLDSDACGTQGIRYQTLGTAPNRRFIAQWDTAHFSNSGTIRFEIILFETTNHIEFRYADVTFGSSSYDGAASATVGITENSSSGALQYSCNTASLSDGMALAFYPY